MFERKRESTLPVEIKIQIGFEFAKVHYKTLIDDFSRIFNNVQEVHLFSILPNFRFIFKYM